MTPTKTCAETFSATEGVDFTLHKLHDHWHWYSQGPQFGDEYCSEDGFETPAAAKADAESFLIEQLKAPEFAEHWSRLWSSDQQSIDSAIQVLPADRREQARYEMAFRTAPMPEQYWPSEA